jgi:hypothetical protein
VLRNRQLPLDRPLKLEIQVPFNSTPTRASIRVSGIRGAVHKQVNAALLMIRQAKGSPFVFVQEFREFSMPDVFIRNLREVSESALDSCCHAADDEGHYTEEREQAPSRGQQWTQAPGWDGKAR